MTKPTFRVGMHRPTNVYVQVDPASPEDDPQIGYIVEGWAQVLVDQANEASAPKWTKDTTSVVMLNAAGRRVPEYSVLPDSPDSPTDRFAGLLAAARTVLTVYDEMVLDDDDPMRGAIVVLRQAVSAYGPYDQDADR